MSGRKGRRPQYPIKQKYHETAPRFQSEPVVKDYEAKVLGVEYSGLLVCEVRIDKPELTKVVVQMKGCKVNAKNTDLSNYFVWNWLRERLVKVERKTVLLDRYAFEKAPVKYIPTQQWGELPLIFSRVIEKGQERRDLGETAVAEGIMSVWSGKDEQVGGYLKHLMDCEKEAKEGKIGIWSPEYAKRSIEKLSERDILSIRCFNAIVTNVISGTRIELALLPSLTPITMVVAGCRSENTNSDIGRKGKKHVITGLFQRNVNVRICDKDKSCYLGYFIGRTDRVGIQAMIEQGYFTYNVATARLTPNADTYIRCELKAVKAKSGVWANRSSHYDDNVFGEFEGQCVHVKNTNCVVIRRGSEDKTVYLSCLDVPYCVSVNEADVSGLRARDFLRTFIGKNIKAVITGAYHGREYAAIYHGGKLIQEEFIRLGLAELTEPFAGRRVEEWDMLKEIEATAKQEKVGIWSGEASESAVQTNYVEHGRAIGEMNPLKGKTVEVSIEGIVCESKFVVYMPSQRCLFRASVNHIKPWPKNSKHGPMAKEYARENYHQRTASLRIVAFDKGYAVCDIAVSTPSGSIDIAQDLARNGMAKVNRSVMGPKRGRFHHQDPLTSLIRAEESAIFNDRGVWKDKIMHQYRNIGKIQEVKVVSVSNAITFGVQFMDRDMIKIERVLSETEKLEQLKSMPMIHEGVVVKQSRDDEDIFVRARVEDVYEEDRTLLVAVIDYNTNMTVPLDVIYKMPAEIADIGPQAAVISLGCCKLIDESEAGIDTVWEVCKEAKLFVHLMYRMGSPYVLVTDKRDVNSGSLNYYLISRGIAAYQPYIPPRGAKGKARELHPVFNKVIEQLQTKPEPVEDDDEEPEEESMEGYEEPEEEEEQ